MRRFQKYDKCYQLVQSLVSGVSEKEAHDALNSSISKGPQAHDDISQGLLVWILSDPAASNKVKQTQIFRTCQPFYLSCCLFFIAGISFVSMC